MQRSTWTYVLFILLMFSGSLGACASQEEPPSSDLLADTTQSGRPATVTDGRTVAQRLEDATIATEVRKALLDTLTLRRFDFDVAAARGRVVAPVLGR